MGRERGPPKWMEEGMGESPNEGGVKREGETPNDREGGGVKGEGQTPKMGSTRD